MKNGSRYLALFLGLIIYIIPGWGMQTKLDFFVPLSQSFLQGKIYVGQMRTELHEMVSQEEIDSGIPSEPEDGVVGKYYVIYPPMPAVLLMPFVAFWGENTNQSAVSILFSIASIYIAYLVFKELKLGNTKSIWLTTLYAFGSSTWYHALVGSSWYFASVCGLLMLWLAILSYLKKNYWFMTGVFIGLAFLCRFPMILCLPFFLTYKRPTLSQFVKLILPIMLAILIALTYNFVRYGRWDNYGYKLLESRWYNINYEYTRGSYDLSYLPRHLKTFFLDMPNSLPTFPFLSPNMHGMAVWIVFPAILILFSAPKANMLVKGSLLAILATIPAHFFHGGVGATQFGYRYMLDYLPFILMIIAATIKEKFYFWHILLMALSVIVNIWGVTSLLMIK